MFKSYIDYFKDNPHGHWFKRKVYGWGWVPVTWQGWVVVGVYIVLVVGIARLSPYTTPLLGSSFYSVLLPFIILTILFVAITLKKGERPHWSWGLPEKYKK